MKKVFQPLNNVAVVIMGQSPSSETYNRKGDGLPFFQGKAEFGDIHPVATKWCSTPLKIANKNDILISVRAPVGPTNIADKRCCIGRGLAAIRPIKEKTDRDYLWYYLRFVEAALVEKGQGSTFESINSDDLKSLEIPMYPLTEQRRISARLKAQLAEVEKARNAAEMQTVEIANIIELAIENKISVSLAKGKREVFLGDIVDLTAKLVDPTAPEMCILPHVSAENIASVTGEILGLKSAGEDGMRSSKYMFESGDVLYSKLRPYLRKVALPDFAGLCSADMYPLKANPEFIDSRFLKILLSSKIFTEYANEKSARSRMPKLNREQLFSWEFRLPSLEIQKTCIEKIEQVIYQANIAKKAAKVVASEIYLLPYLLLSQAFEM
ncbi:MAG: restriction endonuclease subunit S [Deltaproteobacteria bacterium]|jgi:type I restriction enzyme, S subunit